MLSSNAVVRACTASDACAERSSGNQEPQRTTHGHIPTGSTPSCRPARVNNLASGNWWSFGESCARCDIKSTWCQRLGKRGRLDQASAETGIAVCHFLSRPKRPSKNTCALTLSWWGVSEYSDWTILVYNWITIFLTDIAISMWFSSKEASVQYSQCTVTFINITENDHHIKSDWAIDARYSRGWARTAVLFKVIKMVQ